MVEEATHMKDVEHRAKHKFYMQSFRRMGSTIKYLKEREWDTSLNTDL